MYLRVGVLGIAITVELTVGTDDDDTLPATNRGISGGSTHNFERCVDDTTYEYEEEPEDVFGFH